jgi:hypothetical protein
MCFFIVTRLLLGDKHLILWYFREIVVSALEIECAQSTDFISWFVWLLKSTVARRASDEEEHKALKLSTPRTYNKAAAGTGILGSDAIVSIGHQSKESAGRGDAALPAGPNITFDAASPTSPVPSSSCFLNTSQVCFLLQELRMLLGGSNWDCITSRINSNILVIPSATLKSDCTVDAKECFISSRCIIVIMFFK